MTLYKIARISLLSVLCVLIPAPALAQTGKNLRPATDNCETVSSKLDFVGTRYNQATPNQGFIVIIGQLRSRTGTERVNGLIQDAIRYLNKFHDIREEKVVFGINSLDTAKSELLRIFVGGQLAAELNVTQASRLCFGMGESFDKGVR